VKQRRAHTLSHLSTHCPTLSTNMGRSRLLQLHYMQIEEPNQLSTRHSKQKDKQNNNPTKLQHAHTQYGTSPSLRNYHTPTLHAPQPVNSL